MDFVGKHITETALVFACTVSGFAIYHIVNAIVKRNRELCKTYNLRTRCKTCKRACNKQCQSDSDSDDTDYVTESDRDDTYCSSSYKKYNSKSYDQGGYNSETDDREKSDSDGCGSDGCDRDQESPEEIGET